MSSGYDSISQILVYAHEGSSRGSAVQVVTVRCFEASSFRYILADRKRDVDVGIDNRIERRNLNGQFRLIN